MKAYIYTYKLQILNYRSSVDSISNRLSSPFKLINSWIASNLSYCFSFKAIFFSASTELIYMIFLIRSLQKSTRILDLTLAASISICIPLWLVSQNSNVDILSSHWLKRKVCYHIMHSILVSSFTSSASVFTFASFISTPSLGISMTFLSARLNSRYLLPVCK
jgi:hypothetical protein